MIPGENESGDVTPSDYYAAEFTPLAIAWRRLAESWWQPQRLRVRFARPVTPGGQVRAFFVGSDRASLDELRAQSDAYERELAMAALTLPPDWRF